MDRRAFIAGAATLVAAPRALAGLTAGTEVALVTADEEARLVAVDLATGRVRRYVRTLASVAVPNGKLQLDHVVAGLRGPSLGRLDLEVVFAGQERLKVAARELIVGNIG